MSILEIKDLSKAYGKGEAKTNALSSVFLSVEENEFVVILGFSGSGKSTLLNMIGAMDKPDSGSVLYKGMDIVSLGDKKRCEYRRNEVGFVFQNFNLVDDLTALENVEMTAAFFKDADAPGMLEAVGLKDKMKNYPSEMSGGQQQRVSIARALVKKGDLLLCDEPTGALDSETGIKILKLLKDVAQKYHKTVLFVTHTREIADIADKVVLMKNGKIESVTINEHPKNPEDIRW